MKKKALKGPAEKIKLVVMREAMKHLIEKAEKNVASAIDRHDYCAATKAESYLTGLQVAREVIESS